MPKRWLPCRRICSNNRNKNKTEPNESAPSVYRRRILAATVVLAAARGRQKGAKRSVFVKAIEQRHDDGQPAAVQNVGTENPVFAAKNEKCNQNPKSCVTLRKAIHKETSCVSPQGLCTLLCWPAVLSFYYIIFFVFKKSSFDFSWKRVHFLAKGKKMRYNKIMQASFGRIRIRDSTHTVGACK